LILLFFIFHPAATGKRQLPPLGASVSLDYYTTDTDDKQLQNGKFYVYIV